MPESAFTRRLRQRDPKLARSRLEALLSMASGAVAEPVAGLAGLLGAVTGGAGRGTRAIEAARNALTYQPRDPRGMQEIASAVAPIASRIEQGKRYLGDSAYNATGSPALAAAAYTAPEGLAALVGLRGAGMRGPTMTQMAERSAGPTMGAPQGQFGAIGAWHGSPYDFDQFSLDKIGTGEGAQAYGHGLYFAGNRDVAENYRQTLAGDNFVTGDGELFNPNSLRHMNIRVMAGRGDFDGAIAKAAEIEKSDSPVAYLAMSDRLTLEELKAKGGFRKNEGRTYEVELAPDETDLLDWDAPLSQQPEKVRAALDDFGWTQEDMTGGDFYRALGFDYMPSPKEASKRLREIGIPGLRYLDGGSRAAGDGSRNYVIFDDKLVTIKGKE